MAGSVARPIQDQEPLPMPQVADPTYYGARDLDVFPRPIAPLDLERIAAEKSVSTRLLIVLRIDERGVVNDVAFPEPVATDRLREALLGALMATRFSPARKDGRAVRSRVTVSVDF